MTDALDRLEGGDAKTLASVHREHKRERVAAAEEIGRWSRERAVELLIDLRKQGMAARTMRELLLDVRDIAAFLRRGTVPKDRIKKLAIPDSRPVDEPIDDE